MSDRDQTVSGKEQSLSSLESKYFPAVCSAAHRPFLTPLLGPNGEALSLRCPSCGAAARVIGGSYYIAQDDQRFERIVDIVHGHRIPADQARATLTLLDGLIRESEAAMRRGLLSVLNAESLAPFDPRNREELIAFVSLLSGLLSVQYESLTAAESARRSVAGVQSEEDLSAGDTSRRGS